MQYRRSKYFLSVFLILLFVLGYGYSGSASAAAPCADGEHIFDVELLQPATGETDGLRRYTCSICGYTYDETIPATGHQWSEWIVDIEPTCTELGHRYRVCSKYAEHTHMEEESIPALGHDYLPTVTAPTCTANGETTYTCSRCGESYTEYIAQLSHDYVLAVTAPTCAASGEITYTCSHCGESYTEEIPQLSHDYQLTSEQAATCEQEGVRTYTCTHCGKMYTQIIPELGHQYGAWIVDTPATEEQDGSKYRVCANNPAEVERESIPHLRASEAVTEPVEETSEIKLEPIAEEPIVGKTAPLNKLDFFLVVSTILTCACCYSLSLPYVRVLNWANKKKKQIDTEQGR